MPNNPYQASGKFPTEEVQDWKEFWGRAMPVLMELGIRLDDAGFGMGEEKGKEET